MKTKHQLLPLALLALTPVLSGNRYQAQGRTIS